MSQILFFGRATMDINYGSGFLGGLTVQPSISFVSFHNSFRIETSKMKLSIRAAFCFIF